MRELVVQWYAILGSLNAAVALPLREMAASAELPLLSALLLGLIGATSPCQITTNLSALAYLGRKAGNRAVMARGGLAYLLGKALVYTLLGTAVILAGQQFAQASIPVIATVRRLVGPVMVLLGLHLLGFLPLLVALASIAALGVQATRSLSTASRKTASRLQPIAAAVILLAGLNDTILYWIV